MGDWLVALNIVHNLLKLLVALGLHARDLAVREDVLGLEARFGRLLHHVFGHDVERRGRLLCRRVLVRLVELLEVLNLELTEVLFAAYGLEDDGRGLQETSDRY